MAVTAPPAGRRALDAVQALAIVVAIGAGLAASFTDEAVRVLTLGFLLVALIGWRYATIRVALAAVAVLILVADAMGRGPTDRGWVRVAVVALVVAGVLGARASRGSVPTLASATNAVSTSSTTTAPSSSTRRSVGVRAIVGPAAALVVLALVAFALGPDIDLESSRTSESGSTTFPSSSAEVTPPARGSSAKALQPYLGFEQSLDTGARGALGDDIVLRVEADAPDFWRGQSFDRWDGQTWTQSIAAPTVRVSTERGIVPGTGVDVERFEQRFRVEAPAIADLYAAYQPIAVDLPPRTFTYRSDGSVALTRPLGRGSEYTVTSLRALVTPEVLRARDPLSPGSRPPSGAMEGAVSARVARLARRITADAPTTYDAIRAIEHWMAAHTTYTTDIPALPAGADAVEQHLFVDRKGFCVQIATSTATMLHSLGVPVRLGVGFVPGDPSILGRSYTVRASDAHAWIEVWFPGVGWQAFDPTADVPLAGQYDRSLLAQVLRVLRRFLVVAVLAVVALIVIVAAWVVRRRRRRVEPPWVRTFLRQIEREGRARGRPRAPTETPQRYLAALAEDALPAPEELAVVAQVVTEAAYGPRPPDPGEQQRAEAAFAAATAVPPTRRRADRSLVG